MGSRGLIKEVKSWGLPFRAEEPLSRYTTIRTGGRAKVMIFPENVDQLLRLWEILWEERIPFFLLSGGSKVLFTDEGFPGVVVNLRSLRGVRELSPGRLEVLCGTPVAALIAYALRHGFEGPFFLAGVPATVGGALFMNAGAFGRSFGELVEEVVVLTREGVVKKKGSPELWEYRRFNGPEGCVLKAILRLSPASSSTGREALFQTLARRRATQPLGKPSFGCAFRNPEGTSAGLLMDKAGLKGLRRGKAQISNKHANFILNLGGARSQDILDLMREAQERVYQLFGVHLEPEVRIVGQA